MPQPFTDAALTTHSSQLVTIKSLRPLGAWAAKEAMQADLMAAVTTLAASIDCSSWSVGAVELALRWGQYVEPP